MPKSRNVLFQNLWQPFAEYPSQRKRQAVKAYIVVFVVRARIVDLARFHLAATELFHSEEIGVLPPQLSFPLTFLLQMVFPTNLGVVRRVIAAVVDIGRDGIIDAVDEVLS